MNLTESRRPAPTSRRCARAEPQPDGGTRSSAPRSSSPTASTTWPRTSCTWCWHACRTRRPGSGHQPVRGAQVPGQRRRLAGRAQRRTALRLDRAQARHQGQPTAVLQFGDHGGAIGESSASQPGPGYMFIMMNAARFAVGMQGIAVSDRAYQQALAYARDRVQSRDLAGSPAPVAIIHHPDVKRMLLTMKAQTEAARALAYCAASHSDLAHHAHDEAVRREHLAIYGTWCRWSRATRPRWPTRSPAWASRSMAAWASSRRPARRSITAMRASWRSTGHDGDPGQRLRRAQDGARRRCGGQGAVAPRRGDRAGAAGQRERRYAGGAGRAASGAARARARDRAYRGQRQNDVKGSMRVR